MQLHAFIGISLFNDLCGMLNDDCKQSIVLPKESRKTGHLLNVSHPQIFFGAVSI